MADGGVSRSSNEQERLGQSVRTQHKYGTATRAPSSAATTELFVKHFVQKDETLAGIALKYGHTIQQLKSINNLWSDWQLGVCEFILIPVSSTENHCSPASLSPLTSPPAIVNNGSLLSPLDHSASCELVTRQELSTKNKPPSSVSAGNVVCNAATASSPASQTSCPSTSVQEYFSKYDMSLEKIKKNVNRIEQTMNSRLDSQNPLTMLPHHHHRPHGRHSGATWHSDVETLDPLHEPELRFSSDRDGDNLTSAVTSCSAPSVNRHVAKPYVPSQTASQRLQRTHDDFFQL